MHSIAASMLASLLLCVTMAGPAFARNDVRHGKDHPLLSRYPNSRITEYAKNFNAVDFAVGRGVDGKVIRQRVEGNMTGFRYFHNDRGTQPSALQVIRNYQNAIKSIGGEVVYESLPDRKDGDGETTLRVTVGDKETWVLVKPSIFSSPTHSYQLVIVEVATMQQVVGANKMLDEINKKGFIALYINFDTGKSELKPDAQATVREIVAMLKASPTLAIAIEGHTDNVGAAAANKALSDNRAQSVMNAVLTGGIPASRLSATGYGAERPIADNRGEEGRAKNRRVELVKK